MAYTLYIVMQKFRDDDPVPVFRRMREKGRMLLDGVYRISGYVDLAMVRSFELMEARDFAVLASWMSRWCDLIEFEAYPVVSSHEGIDRLLHRL